MTTVLPYGSWPSPVTPDVLVQSAVGLSSPSVEGGAIFWNELRPAEGGRQVIVRRDPDGTIHDAIPPGWSARTLVHEYGGRCSVVHAGRLWFSNFEDQRLYVTTVRPASEAVAEPRPISPVPDAPRGARYADPVVTPDGAWLICVREQHTEHGVDNDLVAFPASGDGPLIRLASGHDFFSAPRVSPDGQRLAWLCWDHPQMPWDSTALHQATLITDGPPALADSRLVAGGPQESVTQPRYSPAGVLHFASDRTGYWRLFADRGPGQPPRPVATVSDDAEFSGPDWIFGQSTYVFLDDGTIVAAWTQAGAARLGVLPAGAAQFAPVETPWTALDGLAAAPDGGGVVAVAGSPTAAPAIAIIDTTTGRTAVVRTSRPAALDVAYISAPDAIEFPTEGGASAHALYYPAHHPHHRGPAGELPPLIVLSHGGPTLATTSTLNYAIQFWTTRGIAVVDVNYGGSTGYGRAYRQRLRGNWGVTDVADCINAARWLAEEGVVDAHRLVIRGGSAGGYTTLCAVTFHQVFAAGASLYGVADLRALAEDTHKFESRYLDGLVGPWPGARAVYEARSPVLHSDQLRTPLILFQGLQDKVVPPAQAEMMVAALQRHGVPHAYLAYPDEQHGFRQAANIRRTAEAELSFYGQVLGFTPAGDVEPVAIVNADAIGAGPREPIDEVIRTAAGDDPSDRAAESHSAHGGRRLRGPRHRSS